MATQATRISQLERASIVDVQELSKPKPPQIVFDLAAVQAFQL